MAKAKKVKKAKPAAKKTAVKKASVKKGRNEEADRAPLQGGDEKSGETRGGR